jgi:hypothetical protein
MGMAGGSRTVQSVFRAANERLRDRLDALVLRGTRPAICECSDVECFELLQVSREEYRAVRKQGWFFVARGHARPDLEHIVERRDGFDIVEKEKEPAA